MTEFQLVNAVCIGKTNLPGFPEPYRGKVRDVYPLSDNTIGIISSDRISAFDHVLRQLIPYKGQILNSLASLQFNHTRDIIESHVIDVPHANITIAKKAKALPIEVVVRGYLAGHALRTYKKGLRNLCGVNLPDGLADYAQLPSPIITPATKAIEGHDEDISESEIISRNIVQSSIWDETRSIAFKLFERGAQIANNRGLILVDTKYEFGIYEDRLILIDEVHTPDSSRYFYSDTYKQHVLDGETPRQLSKEFLREWLISKNFQGLDGQLLPNMDNHHRFAVALRYIELYEQITGNEFRETIIEDYNSEFAKIFNRYKSPL